MTLLSDIQDYFADGLRNPSGILDEIENVTEVHTEITARYEDYVEDIDSVYVRKEVNSRLCDPLTFSSEYVRVSYKRPPLGNWEEFPAPVVEEVEPFEFVRVVYRKKE